MTQCNLKSIRKVTLFGAVVNILLSILKVTVGFLSNTQSLIADGVHSLSDLFTDCVILIGAKFWEAPPDSKHPYGHGRIETLINLLISIILGIVAIGIGWKAVFSINQSHSSSLGKSALIISIISIVSKELLYHLTISVGIKTKTKALVANAWHHRSDALSSIPVLLAVIGNYFFPQIYYFDHIAAIIIMVMLLRVSWDISKPCLEEILETHSEKLIEEEIINISKNFPEIKEIHNIYYRKMGKNVIINLHMLVKSDTNILNAHNIAKKLKQEIIKNNESVIEVSIHIEPKE